MDTYHCYFVSGADKAEAGVSVRASNPFDAADEAILVRSQVPFITIEVWCGDILALVLANDDAREVRRRSKLTRADRDRECRAFAPG